MMSTSDNHMTQNMSYLYSTRNEQHVTHIDNEWNNEHDNDKFQYWISDWRQYQQSYLTYTTSDIRTFIDNYSHIHVTKPDRNL